VDILGGAPENRAMLQNVGFQDDVPLDECFRRLQVLRALRPGILCYDSTWGGGKVRKVDWFYKRVDIDFENKPEHHMSFGYAGETLRILDDDHLLARKMKDPEALQQLVLEDAPEVVRIALRSLGPMPIARLQEELVPRIVAEKDWKRFWDAARKVLKKDPLVDIPARRSDPVALRKKEKAYGEDWFKALAAERNMARVLEQVMEFRREASLDDIKPEQQEIVGDRLAFVIKGAERKHPGWHACAILEAVEFKVAPEQVDTARELADLLRDEPFLEAVRGLPARDLKRFMRQLRKLDYDRTCALLIRLIPQMDISPLNEAMDLLMAHGCEKQCRQVFYEYTADQQCAGVEMLYWLVRHEDRMAAWSLGRKADLARWVLRALDMDVSGEMLKTQNQLRSRFEQAGWLREVLNDMSPGEKDEFVQMIKNTSGWSTLDRRSIMATLVKLDAGLQASVSAREEGKSTASSGSGPVTSPRSYQQRRQQLEHIVQVEIPEVAKEIGVARSYGDLSENHEYKAAKEKQGQLMQRRAELEQMLARVRAFDFDGVLAERAGPGTRVELQYEDGRQELFNVLGVWDRDEALGIISSDSAMAKALEGHRAGEEVAVPSEHGSLTARITAVGSLNNAVRNWIHGEA
jgi:transcription elongation GreA/GreB family factor